MKQSDRCPPVWRQPQGRCQFRGRQCKVFLAQQEFTFVEYEAFRRIVRLGPHHWFELFRRLQHGVTFEIKQVPSYRLSQDRDLNPFLPLNRHFVSPKNPVQSLLGENI